MPFAQNDEQRLLADSVRRFLENENEFEHHRQRLLAKPPERMKLWPGLVELGMLGVAFTEEQGGFDGDARSIAALMVELGRGLAIEPFAACAVFAGRLLSYWQDETARNDLIEKIIGGETLCIPAHYAGTNPFAKPLLKATANGAKLSLNGDVKLVRHADVANQFLVSANCDGQTVLCLLSADASGLDIEHFRLMDGAGAGNLRLDNCEATALELSANGDEALADALEWMIVAQAAEASGIVEMLNNVTFEYLNTREQFGKKLASFQALQHRAADMYMAAEELLCTTELAIDALSSPVSRERSNTISAAKVVADRCAKLIAHDAVQLHGGMGVSDELNVAYFARRIATQRAEFGSADLHKLRFVDLIDTTITNADSATTSGTGFVLPESAEDAAWRAEVKAFVTENLPDDIARKGEYGLKHDKNDYVRWQKILRKKGWFAAKWAKEFGGDDWGLRKQWIFTQEQAICNAPMIIPYGVSMVGPVINKYGSKAQQEKHLPGILESDIWWCQAYSEPGSGSDLASLKTFAKREGDEYVINGAKLWTTEAHWADWAHVLVRTDKDCKPQKGISFLLLDMTTPGIEIRPILTIDGIHHTNAVFFDDVRVPAENLVGKEGQGWTLAKFLLGNERTAIADTGPKQRLLKRIRTMHSEMRNDPTVPDAIKVQLSTKLAEVNIQMMTLCAMERHYISEWESGKPAGPDASALKIRATEVLQLLTQVAMEIEGPLAAAHDPDNLHLDPMSDFSDTQTASFIGHEYLYGRCWTVFGGTNEVQRNIIAQQILA